VGNYGHMARETTGPRLGPRGVDVEKNREHARNNFFWLQQ
jgi:hypothetical protein